MVHVILFVSVPGAGVGICCLVASTACFLNFAVAAQTLSIDILIHNWTSKKYVPLDILNMTLCRFDLGLPGIDCI